MTADTSPQPAFQLPIGGTGVQVRIAEAAIELFYNRGAAATTVREITAACGLTPGALYNHFASKDQLLYVLVRDVHQQVDDQMTIVLAEAGDDASYRLAAAVRLLVAQAAGSRKQSRVANREFTALSPTRRREIIAIRRQLRNRLTDVVESGAHSGQFSLIATRSRGDAALTASVIATMCANISEWTRENHPMSRSDLQDRYVEMSLRLVGADAAQLPGADAAQPRGSGS